MTRRAGPTTAPISLALYRRAGLERFMGQWPATDTRATLALGHLQDRAARLPKAQRPEAQRRLGWLLARAARQAGTLDAPQTPDAPQAPGTQRRTIPWVGGSPIDRDGLGLYCARHGVRIEALSKTGADTLHRTPWEWCHKCGDVFEARHEFVPVSDHGLVARPTVGGS